MAEAEMAEITANEEKEELKVIIEWRHFIKEKNYQCLKDGIIVSR